MCFQWWEREWQLESAEASSMAVICRLTSTPLPWVQWLSGKSIRLVIRRSRVRFPAGSLWIFLSLSAKLTSCIHLLVTIKIIFIAARASSHSIANSYLQFAFVKEGGYKVYITTMLPTWNQKLCCQQSASSGWKTEALSWNIGKRFPISTGCQLGSHWNHAIVDNVMFTFVARLIRFHMYYYVMCHYDY